jgi:hypothetical protein
LLRERFLQTLLLMVGQSVTVTMVDGTQRVGVLHTASPFASAPKHLRHKYVLKASRVISSTNTGQDAPRAVGGSGETVVLNMDQVVSVVVASLRYNDAAPAFQTDTELSQTSPSTLSSPLEAAGPAWVGSNSNSQSTMRLTPTGRSNGKAAGGGLAGKIGNWDQFSANEKLFKITASFNENVYTTELDKSKMNDEQIRKAEKLAKEIESSTSTNTHVAEERGHVVEGDYDEEDRYAGVLRAKAETLPTSSNKSLKPTKVMNYAAAAAKQSAPPGFSNSKDKIQTPAVTETIPEKPERLPVTAAPEPVVDPKPVAPEKEAPVQTAPVPDEPKQLSAKAKEFTFNINAKTFTPNFGPSPMQQPPQQQHPYGVAIDPNTGVPIDPNTGVPIGMGMVHPSMYMRGHMPQPGMLFMYKLCLFVAPVMFDFLTFFQSIL